MRSHSCLRSLPARDSRWRSRSRSRSRRRSLTGSAPSPTGRLGAHTLQECEGFIWPSRHIRVKHAVEAERRAFGEVKHFADVKVSPYPYKGTRADLGPIQEKLLEHASRACEGRLSQEDGFMVVWVMQGDGSIVDVKKSSQKKAREFIREVAKQKHFIGAVSAQLLLVVVCWSTTLRKRVGHSCPS
jgi:hypothetical protein